MKTRHVLAIGLLSALAVGLLAFGISKTKHKPKTLQTNAYFIKDVEWQNYDVSYKIQMEEESSTITNEQTAIWTLNGYIGIETSNIRKQTTIDLRNLNILYIQNIQNLDDTEAKIYTYENGDSFNQYWGNYDTGNITQGPLITMTDTRSFSLEWIKPTLMSLHSDPNDIETNRWAKIRINYAKKIILTNENWYGYWDFYMLIQEIEDMIPFAELLEPTYDTLENYIAIEWANIHTQNEQLYQSYSAGDSNGYNIGYEQGYEEGTTEGYNTGYGIGYNDSEAFNHPIDFAPLMLNILTMPFTFISQAFDVTLWPGTQYQINIGNFIKAMIAISAILFIIRLFTSGFSIIGNYTTNINKEAKMRSENRKSKQAWKSQKITEKGAKQANKE